MTNNAKRADGIRFRSGLNLRPQLIWCRFRSQWSRAWDIGNVGCYNVCHRGAPVTVNNCDGGRSRGGGVPYAYLLGVASAVMSTTLKVVCGIWPKRLEAGLDIPSLVQSEILSRTGCVVDIPLRQMGEQWDLKHIDDKTILIH